MTEKQYAPTKQEKKISQKVETPKVEQPKVPVEKKKSSDEKKEISLQQIGERPRRERNRDAERAGGRKEISAETNVKEKSASEVSKKEEEKEKKKKPAKKIKKDEVVVNATGVHVSTKYAVAICEFVRRKRIEDAILDLENVLAKKMHIPMRGEYAHKRGAGKVASGAGKYPQYATEQFIVLLKSLLGNAQNHDVEEPVIVEAVANFGNRPMGRFGRWQRKRTNIKLVAREVKSAAKRNKNLKKVKKKGKEQKKISLQQIGERPRRERNRDAERAGGSEEILTENKKKVGGRK